MTLSELAFACYVYGGMSDYDKSYLAFQKKTQPELDLTLDKHRKALIRWLNAWGCRQFALAYHALASEQIGEWYSKLRERLFPRDKALADLSGADLAVIESAYADLASRTASRKVLRGAESEIRIGPTGAAKILFALRPTALLPWDEPIRKHFRLDDSANAYVEYLGLVKQNLEELGKVCVRHGHILSDLPELLGRPTSSLPKLIDEYHWVTITRRCRAPSTELLATWAGWR